MPLPARADLHEEQSQSGKGHGRRLCPILWRACAHSVPLFPVFPRRENERVISQTSMFVDGWGTISHIPSKISIISIS
jgi:hypothetical protein